MKDPFGNKVTIAPQEKVKMYIGGVSLLISNLGLPWALVTDESKLTEFLSSEDATSLLACIPIEFEPTGLIWELAKLLEAHPNYIPLPDSSCRRPGNVLIMENENENSSG